MSGRIVLRKLDVLRMTVTKDPNLVISVGANTVAALELVIEYIATLKEIVTEFKETPGDIAEGNAAGQVAIEEMVELESELLGIRRYCKVNMAGSPRPEDTIPVQKLKAQDFPKFDGTDDGTTYLIWKDQMAKMIDKIRDPNEKKNRLLECLVDGAQKIYQKCHYRKNVI